MRAALCVTLLLVAAWIVPASAQQDDEIVPGDVAGETPAPIRRYAVELIIFAYSEAASAGTEIWRPDPPPAGEMSGAATDRLRDSYSAEFSDRGDVLSEIGPPAAARRYIDPELYIFAADDYGMGEIYDKLVKLDAYEPILRAGWSQPTFDKAVTAPIDLRTLANSPSWLNGSLTLYRGRYLHLVVDLTMDEIRRQSIPNDGTSQGTLIFGDARVQGRAGPIDADGRLQSSQIRYRIFEDRIMKTGDVRYFDHPKFGVIAKVTREKSAEDEVIDDTENLMPGDLPGP